jgi:hypothetical protein
MGERIDQPAEAAGRGGLVSRSARRISTEKWRHEIVRGNACWALWRGYVPKASPGRFRFSVPGCRLVYFVAALAQSQISRHINSRGALNSMSFARSISRLRDAERRHVVEHIAPARHTARIRSLSAFLAWAALLNAWGAAWAQTPATNTEAIATRPSIAGGWRVKAETDQRMGVWITAAAAAQAPTEGQRYWAGMSWLSLTAKPTQTIERDSLVAAVRRLGQLDQLGHDASARGEVSRKGPAPSRPLDSLAERLSALPITGRLVIPIQDPWLMQAHPDAEPIVRAGDEIIVPTRPTRVRVARADGGNCDVRHQAGAATSTYLRRCGEPMEQADRAWLIQPDGRTFSVSVAPWNAKVQPPPAPGAWIWLPPIALALDPDLESRVAQFLATQGPVPEGNGLEPLNLPPTADSASEMPRDAVITASDWGLTGLLQTPSARLPQSGTVGMTVSHTAPYTHITATLSPFDRVELGFRYSSLSNQRYGEAIAGDQSLKDKSAEFKFLVWEEGPWVPAVALGLRDPGGTGLFGGEYVVASKRWAAWDFNLGLGWGYLGRRGNLANPLALLGDRFRDRGSSDIGQGGTANLKSLFTGRTAVFGGAQWETPVPGLLAKAEWDGNDYRREPFASSFRARSPLNLGLVWRQGPLDITLGVQRGDQAQLSFALRSDLTALRVDKVSVPPPVRVVPPEYRSPAVALSPPELARQLLDQTGWHVLDIERGQTQWTVRWDESQGYAWPQRLERAMALIDREAPAGVNTVKWSWHQHGVLIDTRITDRALWVKAKTQWSAQPFDIIPARPNAVDSAISGAKGVNADPIAVDKRADEASPKTRRPWSVDTSISLQQHLGGPDGYLFAINGNVHGQMDLWSGAWLQGGLQGRLVDNYDRFRYTADSSLPRVRTNIREYITTSQVTIPWLQATQLNRWGDGVYTLAYAGLLEPMFAGAGAEALWRPAGSRFGVGMDVNRVASRSFEQNFKLRDYRVDTGHLSVYWDTGWMGVQTQLSAGRYLAGDKGATVLMSRRFDNGVTMGAWATKTNVSAVQFGEGSFDKGVYITIPFDAFTTGWSRQAIYIPWQPLIRDGGARLNRGHSLWSLTQARDDQAWRNSAFAR